jgi:iron complex outermembrane receptor protein
METHARGNKNSRTTGTLALTIGALLAAAAAQAQQAPAAREGGLEEIIVTAQKQEENIQTVPFSVTAVTGQSLERFQYNDLKDLNGTIPNVEFTQITNVSLNLAPSIRGIGITNNPDPYTGTEVAVVIDGVVQGTRLLGLSDQFDVERIEVLRGPQGTLFGANTLGGVVNIITRQPTGELGAYGTASIGNYSLFNVAAGLNFPLVDDVLAGKISISHRERDGFYTNIPDGSDLMWVDSTKARGYLLFTPNEGLKATLTVGADRIRNGADVAANISSEGEVFWRPGIDTGVHRDLYTDSPHINDADLELYSLNVDWDSPFGQITSITNYTTFDAFNIQDVDELPEFLLNAGRDLKSYQWSEELRSAFQPTESINAIVGLFYMKLHHDINTITLIDGLAPGVFTEQHVRSDEKTMAAFGQVYWDMTDKWRLGLGLRMTQIDIDLSSENVTHFLEGMHPYHYKENLANSAVVGGFVANGDETWTEPGGKVSLDYHVNDDVMLYAYYARGFKSGGFNGRITDPLDIGPYDPEFIDSYEVGMRSDWLNKRLRANVAVFYNQWDDMQVPQSVFRGDPPQASSTILNAASATTKGAELELEAAPTDAFTLRATVGYLDAAYDEFDDAGVDFSGRPTPYSPEWTGSLTATYDFSAEAGAFTPSVQWTYTDERWAAFTQFPAEHLDSYSVVNANLNFKPNNGNWSVALWATNLLDEDYVISSLTVPPLFSFASFGAPRQYGVDVKFDF